MQDQKLGSWWLGVILDHNILEPVGYWPAFLFTLQADYVEIVHWGGEITNMNTFGRHTTTQMGSGCFPDSGFEKVAYMRNLEIALSENDFQPLQDLEVGATQPEYYRAKKLNNTYFYYGGSEQLKSRAIHLTLDYILLYIGFSLFLLVQFFIIICLLYLVSFTFIYKKFSLQMCFNIEFELKLYFLLFFILQMYCLRNQIQTTTVLNQTDQFLYS